MRRTELAQVMPCEKECHEMEQLRGDTWLSGQYYAGNASSCEQGEALLLVVKVVLVVFLTYPNDNEDIEWTKQTWL